MQKGASMKFTRTLVTGWAMVAAALGAESSFAKTKTNKGVQIASSRNARQEVDESVNEKYTTTAENTSSDLGRTKIGAMVGTTRFAGAMEFGGYASYSAWQPIPGNTNFIVSPEVGLSHAQWSYYMVTLSVNTFTAGARCDLKLGNNFVIFASPEIAYINVSLQNSYTGYDPGFGGAGIGLGIGAMYNFTNNFGVRAEFATSLSGLRLGATYTL